MDVLSPRVAKLKSAVQVEYYPVCIEKVKLMTEVFRCTEGTPEILRRAKAHSYMLDNITIFVRDGELCSMNFLTLGQSFAGRIETPHLGVVDFFIQLSHSCSCVLSCRDSLVRDSLAERASDIQEALIRHYGRGSVQVFTASEIREKVVALTGEIGNHTFNVTI